MGRFTVKQGRRYQANIRLGLVQSWTGNETVAGKFEEAGFTEVEVTGSGRNRLAKVSSRILTPPQTCRLRLSRR
jgi:hypothetical protein